MVFNTYFNCAIRSRCFSLTCMMIMFVGIVSANISYRLSPYYSTRISAYEYVFQVIGSSRVISILLPSVYFTIILRSLHQRFVEMNSSMRFDYDSYIFWTHLFQHLIFITLHLAQESIFYEKYFWRLFYRFSQKICTHSLLVDWHNGWSELLFLLPGRVFNSSMFFFRDFQYFSHITIHQIMNIFGLAFIRSVIFVFIIYRCILQQCEDKKGLFWAYITWGQLYLFSTLLVIYHADKLTNEVFVFYSSLYWFFIQLIFW